MLLIQPRAKPYGTAGDYFAVVRDVLLSRGSGSQDLARLEQCVAEQLGVAHAVAVPQCRVGIYLLLRQLLGERKKVVITAYTLHEVVNMIRCAGGEPVFADVDRRTCNADPREVVDLLDDRTGAVIVTHVHGLVSPMEEITAACRARNIPVIEDAAQAFGGRREGKFAGTLSTAGVFSFGTWKNVNSLFGGMVVSDDGELARAVREQLDSFPPFETSEMMGRLAHCVLGEFANNRFAFSLFSFWLFRFGYRHDINAITSLWGTFTPRQRESFPEAFRRQMSPLQARLALRQLDRVERQTAARLRRARLYDQGLSGLEQVGLPPLLEDGSHIYLTYPIQVENRQELIRYLREHGRDVAAQHFRNNADLPWQAEFFRDCPRARATADQVVLLPTYPNYSLAQVRENVRWIRRYFGADC